MKRILFSVARKFLSSGEEAALRHLVAELRISHYHRKGIRRIRQRSLWKPSKINLGCGQFSKPGYLNVDIFPGGDLTLDLRRGLPFESNCCDAIFSEHFFEHIDYPEPARHLFRECLRVLKPGGIFRSVFPIQNGRFTTIVMAPMRHIFLLAKSMVGRTRVIALYVWNTLIIISDRMASTALRTMKKRRVRCWNRLASARSSESVLIQSLIPSIAELEASSS
jgi:hypothetical protein